MPVPQARNPAITTRQFWPKDWSQRQIQEAISLQKSSPNYRGKDSGAQAAELKRAEIAPNRVNPELEMLRRHFSAQSPQMMQALQRLTPQEVNALFNQIFPRH